MADRTQRGFTLVETAIVLVVIGLIAGGILVGRDLIRHAELVKLHRQYTELVTAIETFRTKYGCLPGDCSNATEIFGTYSGTPGCPDVSVATPSAPALFVSDTLDSPTCNGDGDGRIDANNTLYEMLTFWQHLAAAGLINGSYTGGVSVGGGSLILPNVNCPLVATSHTRCWMIVDGDHSVWLNLLGNPPLTIVPISLGTVMSAGQQFNSSMSLNGMFTPAEALGYDAKYDDGSPVSGSILIAFGSANCTSGNNSMSSAANVTAQYTSSNPLFNTLPTCNLIYRTGL